ncbi:MAG: c-type cytochrome [Gaiellaceae bacterium]
MARSLPLALVALALVLVAGCGGGETTAPLPETVEGTVEQEEAPTVAEGDPEAGAEVFTQIAQPTCGSCHTYGPAGTDAQVGPNLDEVLPDMSPEEIHEAIVNPDAQIAEGFAAGIMPGTYGESLNEEQLADLVAFLTQGG